MKTSVIICSFSVGIDELRGKKLTNGNVLRILQEQGRFSTFEATANNRIARVMDFLQSNKYFEVDRENSHYPWLKVALTDKGRAAIAAAEGKEE